MNAKNVVYAGLLVSCGMILPQIFHIFGGPGLGAVLLPMHIPVLIAGFILNPVTALIVGLVTPICSFLYTGGSMPAVPMLYFMILELGFYGLTVSLLFKKFKLNIFVSLIGGMVVGRVARGIAFVCATKLFGIVLPPAFGISVAMVQGMPGILIQIIVIPPIVVFMRKMGWMIDEQRRTKEISQGL